VLAEGPRPELRLRLGRLIFDLQVGGHHYSGFAGDVPSRRAAALRCRLLSNAPQRFGCECGWPVKCAEQPAKPAQGNDLLLLFFGGLPFLMAPPHFCRVFRNARKTPAFEAGEIGPGISYPRS